MITNLINIYCKEKRTKLFKIQAIFTFDYLKKRNQSYKFT